MTLGYCNVTEYPIAYTILVFTPGSMVIVIVVIAQCFGVLAFLPAEAQTPGYTENTLILFENQLQSFASVYLQYLYTV